MTETVSVEVAFATPARQEIVELELPAGATVQDAVDRSGLADVFTDYDFPAMPVGIWGREVPRDSVVSDGDRVEIYRPLAIEPREARRLAARS